MLNNYVKKCVLLLVIFAVMLNSAGIQVMASETKDDALNNSIIPIDLDKADERLKKGYLAVPEKFRQELFLYQCITEALDQYVTENNIDDIFYFDLKVNWLYGSRKFEVSDLFSTKIYEYRLLEKEGVEFEEDSYQFWVKGKEDTLYIEIDLKEEKVYLYPESRNYIRISYMEGNKEAYERIREEGKNPLDAYVKSDWNDMKEEDEHLAEVPFKEIGNLDYFIIPEEDIRGHERIYLNVASALKRYMDEKKIDDVFYFNADRDIVSNVTNMIYTCRIRGVSRTLYIDIGSYLTFDETDIRCHAYQVEE